MKLSLKENITSVEAVIFSQLDTWRIIEYVLEWKLFYFIIREIDENDLCTSFAFFNI